MSGSVDVLAVIGTLASIVRTDNGNRYPEINALLDDAEEARAAVAELIAADKEYDAARAAHRAAHNRGRHHELAGARVRFDAACVRRAAALARTGGQS